MQNETIRVHFTETTNPPGKLADAEIHFTGGVFAGLKLIGFAVWERRGGGGRNVTFPARPTAPSTRKFSVNGERRSFALLRPAGATTEPQNRIRDLILDAWAKHAGEQADQVSAAELREKGDEARRLGRPVPLSDGGSIEPDGFRWAPDTTDQATK